MNIHQERILADELRTGAYDDALTVRDFKAVADALNLRGSAPNPNPRTDKPIPITWAEFINLITPADVLKVYTRDALVQDIKFALDNNDRTNLGAFWRGLKTTLVTTSIDAVEARMQTKQPDPDWTPTISTPSRAQELGLPTVTAEDVQTVWHRIGRD